MSYICDATYSVEDNKLRLYASERLDDETFKQVKEMGFKWAPQQELFVAPKWTPTREDLCIALAGEITAEQSTMIERAEAKADRLDNLAQKRDSQANAFHRAAHQISARFAGGQPILVGHHSEKSARRDQKRADNAMNNAVKATNAVKYWNYKAEGVERHANRKSNPAVRARRIKTLLKELRDRQRTVNHAFLCLSLWESIQTEADPVLFKKRVSHYAGAQLETGTAAPYLSDGSYWSMLQENKITHVEVVEKCLRFWKAQSTSIYTTRWISHILNRLGYERAALGEVSLFTGDITATVLQAFAREHGAHKPTAKKDGDKWRLSSTAPLPFHIADAQELILDKQQWCELMQSSGYEVPTPKARRKSTSKNVPLINPTLEEANKLQARWNHEVQEKRGHLGTLSISNVKNMKQAVFSEWRKGSYSPYNTIELDENGNKIWSSYKGKSADPVCRIRVATNNSSLYSPDIIIHIEDKPAKPLPINFVISENEEKTEAV